MDTNSNHNKQIVLICARKTSIILTLMISLVIAFSTEYMIKTTQAASPSTNRNNISLITSNPVGNHDGSEGIVSFGSCNAFGWAVDLDDAELDVTVRIISDNNIITTTVASEYRDDTNPEICPEGTCGFSVWLWGLITPVVEHEITTQAYDKDTGSWIDLGGTPKSLTCWGYPEGVHDGNEGIVDIAECTAFGWAFDPDDYMRDVTVLILSDGITVTTTIADEYRGDINPVFCPEGTCGFSVDLWRRISPRVEHQIATQVYDQETDNWIDLDIAPKALTCMGYELYLPAIIRQP